MRSRVNGRSSNSSKRRSWRSCSAAVASGASHSMPMRWAKCAEHGDRHREVAAAADARRATGLAVRRHQERRSRRVVARELEEDHRQLLVRVGRPGVVPVDDAWPTGAVAAEVVRPQVAVARLCSPTRREPALEGDELVALGGRSGRPAMTDEPAARRSTSPTPPLRPAASTTSGRATRRRTGRGAGWRGRHRPAPHPATGPARRGRPNRGPAPVCRR